MFHPDPPITSIGGHLGAEVVGVNQTLTVPVLGCPGGSWRITVPQGCCVPLGTAFKQLFPAWALSLCKQVTAVSFVPQPFLEVEGMLSVQNSQQLLWHHSLFQWLLHFPDTHVCYQQ